MMVTRDKVLGVTQAAAFAAAGFVVAVGATNVAHAQSLDFMKAIKDFIIGIVDDNIWALIPGVMALFQIGMFAKTYQVPHILKAVGGAAATALWVARWEVLGRLGVVH